MLYKDWLIPVCQGFLAHHSQRASTSMFTASASMNASAAAFGGRGTVCSMWHTSNGSACANAFDCRSTRNGNTVKSIFTEGEKRFTAVSRDIGVSPMRISDG